eukprot:gene10686-10844_t
MVIDDDSDGSDDGVGGEGQRHAGRGPAGQRRRPSAVPAGQEAPRLKKPAGPARVVDEAGDGAELVVLDDDTSSAAATGDDQEVSDDNDRHGDLESEDDD